MAQARTGTYQILARLVSEVAADFQTEPLAASAQAVFNRAVARVELLSFDILYALMRTTRAVSLTRLQGIALLDGGTIAEYGYRRIFAAALAVRVLEQLEQPQLNGG